MSGMRIVEMVQGRPAAVEDPDHARRSRTRSASTRAIGGSTNAVDPSDGDRRAHRRAISNSTTGTRIGRGTPTLVDLQPSGRFLMEEFYYAGGVPAVMRRLGEAGLLPHPDALTANGQTLWDNNKDAPI